MCTWLSPLSHARREPPEGIGEIATMKNVCSLSPVITLLPTSTSVMRTRSALIAQLPEGGIVTAPPAPPLGAPPPTPAPLAPPLAIPPPLPIDPMFPPAFGG